MYDLTLTSGRPSLDDVQWSAMKRNADVLLCVTRHSDLSYSESAEKAWKELWDVKYRFSIALTFLENIEQRRYLFKSVEE